MKLNYFPGKKKVNRIDKSLALLIPETTEPTQEEIDTSQRLRTREMTTVIKTTHNEMSMHRCFHQRLLSSIPSIYPKSSHTYLKGRRGGNTS